MDTSSSALVLARQLPTSGGHRRKMTELLQEIGFLPEEVYSRGTLKHKFPKSVWCQVPRGSFWVRHGDPHLLAAECHRRFRQQAKRVRPDLLENKASGTALIASYQQIQKILRRKGADI